MPDSLTKGRITATAERVARLDSKTHAFKKVDHEHSKIHDGLHFSVETNADAPSTLIIAFKVPDQTKKPHFKFDFISESSGALELLEGATWDVTSGTNQAPINSDRNSSTASAVQGDAGGTWLSDMVVIDPANLTGGSAIRNVEAYVAKTVYTPELSEIILKVDETYALKWTSTDGTNNVEIRASWYEHVDLN